MDIRFSLTICEICLPNDTEKNIRKLGRVVVCMRPDALDDR